MSSTPRRNAAGYTLPSPDSSPVKKESYRSQQPEDSDDENILQSVVPDGVKNDNTKTFIFKNQGHTLGNVLRDHIIRYPETEFCGYSMPHPGERVMHLRIQTGKRTGVSAAQMLKRGLEDIVKMCDQIEDLFCEEFTKFIDS